MINRLLARWQCASTTGLEPQSSQWASEGEVNGGADSRGRPAGLCSAAVGLPLIGSHQWEDGGVGTKTSKQTNTPRSREGREHHNPGVCVDHTVTFPRGLVPTLTASQE